MAIDFDYLMPSGINAGRSVRDIFLSKIDKTPDRCWHWAGRKFSNGYGHFPMSGEAHLAHRVSFELFTGAPPKGIVRHTCDNRQCVNPAHLLDGTSAENHADMRAKGRANLARLEKSGRGVLTKEDILTIRARRLKGETCKEISKDFPVSATQISRVTTGARHQEVSEEMTPNEYMKLALRTNKDMGEKNNMVHAAMLLTSEAGEVMTEIKRVFAYGKDVDTHNIKEELGDILWGIVLMCKTLGFTLEDVMETNIKKLEARYPDLRFSADHAINRNADAEKEAMSAGSAP